MENLQDAGSMRRGWRTTALDECFLNEEKLCSDWFWLQEVVVTVSGQQMAPRGSSTQ